MISGMPETAARVLVLLNTDDCSGSKTSSSTNGYPIDYVLLAEHLGREGADVTVLDHVWWRKQSILRGLASLFGGRIVAVLYAALFGLRYDVVISLSENTAIPLAILQRFMPFRSRHVSTFTFPNRGRKGDLQKRFRYTRSIDRIFVFTEGERRRYIDLLEEDPAKIVVLPFKVEHEWYSPEAVPPPRLNRIGAAGIEYRDYKTLIAAVAQIPEVHLILNAQSHWSMGASDLLPEPLPGNVENRQYRLGTIRDLYAETGILAVPLHENDSVAGLTAILQAMSMGRVVITTDTAHRPPIITHGVNGLLVAPGDIEGWRKAIETVLGDPGYAARLSQEARRWVIDHATVDRWVEFMASHIKDLAQLRRNESRAFSPIGRRS